MSALTTLEMDLDCNKWKKKVSLSSFSHSLQIEKKSEIVLKRFSLSSALVGAAIIAINQSKNIFSIEWSRKSALRQKERRSARGVLHSIRADSDLSLSRARERGFHRLRTVPFFLTCEFSYLLKLDTQKVNSERNARARSESDEIFSRERLLRRRKRSYLNLGGLEAGDGRDLLSSSKHYVYRVDVFLCVWMTIFSRASNICISLVSPFWSKRGQARTEREGGELSFFEKRGRKERLIFKVRMVMIKEITREACVLWNLKAQTRQKFFKKAQRRKQESSYSHTSLRL